MGFFSAITKTAIEVATSPVAIAKDIVSLGNSCGHDSHIETKLKRIKEASDDKEDYEMTDTEDLF